VILALVSDSHGRSAWLKQALPLMKDADLIVHLGDGEKDWEGLRDDLPCPLLQVRGNCDWFSASPDLITQKLDGIQALFTHGHLYSVKQGLDTLYFAAQEKEAQIVAFGHTHVPLVDAYRGVYFINPGSLADTRTIALVRIENGSVVPRIVNVPIK